MYTVDTIVQVLHDYWYLNKHLTDISDEYDIPERKVSVWLREPSDRINEWLAAALTDTILEKMPPIGVLKDTTRALDASLYADDVLITVFSVPTDEVRYYDFIYDVDVYRVGLSADYVIQKALQNVNGTYGPHFDVELCATDPEMGTEFAVKMTKESLLELSYTSTTDLPKVNIKLHKVMTDVPILWGHVWRDHQMHEIVFSGADSPRFDLHNDIMNAANHQYKRGDKLHLCTSSSVTINFLGRSADTYMAEVAGNGNIMIVYNVHEDEEVRILWIFTDVYIVRIKQIYAYVGDSPNKTLNLLEIALYNR